MPKSRKIKNCCHSNEKHDTECIRKMDEKRFRLPRKYSKKRCLTKKISGFTMRSSCAPYKNCKKFSEKNVH